MTGLENHRIARGASVHKKPSRDEGATAAEQ